VSVRALELVRDPEIAAEISAHLVSLERLSEERGRRATGLPALDQLLGGGWPRAALSEISGRRSSGRTAVVRAALAAAITVGESTALVDVGGTLDAHAAAMSTTTASATTSPGPPLLWIRCQAAQALKAADLVVAAGGFGMVALDLCDARLRIPDAAWIRLRHAARAQGTTVLIVSGTRRLGAFAAAAVDLDGAPAFDGAGRPLFARLEVRAHRLRNGRAQSSQARSSTDLEQLPCVSLAFMSRS
jgi:hypothetical protein